MDYFKKSGMKRIHTSQNITILNRDSISNNQFLLLPEAPIKPCTALLLILFFPPFSEWGNHTTLVKP